MPVTLDDLRRFAVTRSLFPPTTLKRAMENMGFVQADPIRAPARAQDLILRHRVRDYRAGDLERRYAKLGIEEDFFINYGFITRDLQKLMHPRPLGLGRTKKAKEVLGFVQQRGEAHPREVDEHFAHGSVTNYWGGTSNATTHLLDAMHYHGMLRIARRDAGIRVYAPHQHTAAPGGAKARRERIDALVDTAVHLYAPVPGASLSYLVRRLRVAVPQWRGELTAALQRARRRLSHARIDGVDWYWPEAESPIVPEPRGVVRLLTPFDPVVWDRSRLELLWNWVYRFEAYTPVAKRKLGYYALPMLWRDRVIGWANLSVREHKLIADVGFVESGPPEHAAFRDELEAELDRVRAFLGENVI